MGVSLTEQGLECLRGSENADWTGQHDRSGVSAVAWEPRLYGTDHVLEMRQ